MATALAHDDTSTQTNDSGSDELSLRDELEAAFERTPSDETPEPAAPAVAGEEKPEGAGRKRDEFGRFAPKTNEPAGTPAEPAAATGAPTPAAGPAASPAGSPAPAPTDLKPPAAWTPQAREEWGTLSPRIKQEIARREWEANRVVQDGAQARQFISAFESVVRPYEMFIRAENSTPLQAVQNMMQTAAELRVGTPQSKAQLVAGLVKNFGIDVQMLDDALNVLINGAAPGGAAPGQQFRDPRVDDLIAQRQREEQQRSMEAQRAEQEQTNEMRSFLGKFAETHEFYLDVKEDMAALIESASRRGEYIDVEKIYARACKMNEEVSSILAQRAAAAQRQQSTSNAVLRARRAASSVRGEATPEGATIPKDDSIRSAIEAAFEGSRL